jgi:putative oxidoreductase
MKTVIRSFPTVARIFLGLVFAVFGLNGFLHFLSMPPPPARAGAFAGALFGSGYLMQLVFATELSAGLLLLRGRFVALALVLIAPVVVNIVAFHLFLAPAGLGLAGAVVAAEMYLAWTHRAAFVPMLRSAA